MWQLIVATALAIAPGGSVAEWTVTETPDLGSAYDFQDVAAIAADDVWAVGTRATDNGTGPVAAHWDGSAWKATETPDGWDLLGVSGAKTDDVWAVGRGKEGSLAAHWDGAAWKPVELPVPDGVTNSCVFAIEYVSDDEVWIFGTTWEKRGWILRWDGRKWNTEETPEREDSVQMTGAATLDGRLCASGYTLDADLMPHPYLLCKDSAGWTEVETPQMNAFVGGIGPAPDGGLLLTGRTFEDAPVLLRYDGSTVVEDTSPIEGEGGLADVAATPDSQTVWLVGSAAGKGAAAHS